MTATMPLVTHWSATSIVPKVSKEAAHLLDKNIVLGARVSFNLENTTTSFANSLRRTILGGLTVKHLSFEPTSFWTNDVFIIDQMVFNRIRMVPVLQSVNLNDEYTLHVKNDSTRIIDVHTGDIVAKDKRRLPFNPSFTICSLNKDKELKITLKIVLSSIRDNGSINIATNATSVPLDQTPINVLDPASKGISSLISNPHIFKIEFKSIGVMPPREIVYTAANVLINRLKKYHDIAAKISDSAKRHVEVLTNEDCTVTEVLCREVFDLNSKVAVYNKTDNNVTTLEINSEDGNIGKVLTTALSNLELKYRSVYDQLKI